MSEDWIFNPDKELSAEGGGIVGLIREEPHKGHK